MEDLLKNPIIVDINNLMEEKRKEYYELDQRICEIEKKIKDKHITVFEHENLVLELDIKKSLRDNLQSVIDGIDKAREIIVDDIIKLEKEKVFIMKEFDWDKFKGNTEMCVHCQTEEEANKFCKMMDEHGMKWCGGGSYLDDTCQSMCGKYTVYCGDGTYWNIKYAKKYGCDIFEFSDCFKGGENK